MIEFKECQQAEQVCGQTHVKFESEAQRRMVFECRERATAQREAKAAQRERFQRTGVWS